MFNTQSQSSLSAYLYYWLQARTYVKFNCLEKNGGNSFYLTLTTNYMLNTKQANPSKLQFMHCNIENTEAQTDFSFSLFLTSRIKGPLSWGMVWSQCSLYVLCYL